MFRKSIAIGMTLAVWLGGISSVPVKATGTSKAMSRSRGTSKAPRVVFVRRAVNADQVLTDVDGEPNTVIVHRDTVPFLTLLEKAIPF